ncbi:MAG: hypothetical protein WCT29_02695 [Candidatus Paceibacterota bacterium]
MTKQSLDLKDKMIYAHKGYFDRESVKHYRENSVEVCKIASTKDYIKAIEVDVRKSSDGILYCYHGNFWQYIFLLKIPQTFTTLQKKYHVATLKDILSVISSDKIIALDIKDTKITKADILNAFAGKKFKEVVIINKSTAYLERFDNMSKEFVKMLNVNVFPAFCNLEKLKGDNFKYFEILFPFLATKKILQKIKDSGLEWTGFPAIIFTSEESYRECVEKYKIPYLPAHLFY